MCTNNSEMSQLFQATEELIQSYVPSVFPHEGSPLDNSEMLNQVLESLLNEEAGIFTYEYDSTASKLELEEFGDTTGFLFVDMAGNDTGWLYTILKKIADIKGAEANDTPLIAFLIGARMGVILYAELIPDIASIDCSRPEHIIKLCNECFALIQDYAVRGSCDLPKADPIAMAKEITDMAKAGTANEEQLNTYMEALKLMVLNGNLTAEAAASCLGMSEEAFRQRSGV